MSDNDLPSGSELEQISEIRKALETELRQLEATSANFPHTTGDIFMTRLLRGNNGNVEESVKWYRNCLELRAKFGLDDVHRRASAQNLRWSSTALPHSEDMAKYFNFVFDESLLSLTGHVVWYDAIGDARTAAMLKEFDKEKATEFFKYLVEIRSAVLDRMSVERGRLIRNTRIMDFEASGMWQMNKEWNKFEKEVVYAMLMGTSIEHAQVLFVINFPWFFVKVWDTIKGNFPSRVVSRVRVLGSDFMSNPEYLAEVGPALTAELLAKKRNRDPTGYVVPPLEGGLEYIPPGRVMERVVEVAAGQRVSWSYKVCGAAEVSNSRSFLGKIATAATSMLESSEVVFSVVGIWTDRIQCEIPRIKCKARSVSVFEGGAAEFWMNDALVEHKAERGVNLVALDANTQELRLKQCYDFAEGSQGLKEDLAALPKTCIVLVALKGKGAESLTEEALESLRGLGGTLQAGIYQQGYALIGSTWGVATAETKGNDAVAEGEALTMDTTSELVASTEVSPSSGLVEGSTDVERGGLVVVKWSNYHSFVHKKALSEYKVSVA